MNISKKAKLITWLCTVVYFASYIMRINFAAIMVKVGADMDLPKTSLAIVVTALTIAYGTGQIVSGLLGDKLKPSHMLTAGLLLACVCNVLMFFANSIPVMTVIWGVNGFAHSLLWPPMVRIMSTYLTSEEYSYCSLRVYCGSSGATVLIYLFAPMLMYVTSWRGVMLACAAIGAVTAVIWVLNCKKALVDPVNVKIGDDKKITSGVPLPKFVYMPLVFIALAIALQGVLRDGVTNWMPSYLLETFGLSEENSIVSTVITAVFSVISFWFFDYIYRKFVKNEVQCAAVIFGASAIFALALYLVNTLTSIVAVSMVLMALIVGCMHGINLMLITFVPKRFVKSGKVSTISGVLNAFTYVGSAASTYAFAAFAESRGWSFTIFTWFIISILGALAAGGAYPLWKRFRRTYSDDPNV